MISKTNIFLSETKGSRTASSCCSLASLFYFLITGVNIS